MFHAAEADLPSLLITHIAYVLLTLHMFYSHCIRFVIDLVAGSLMEVLKHPHHHAAVDSCNGLVPAEAAAVPADMEHGPVRETQEFV